MENSYSSFTDKELFKLWKDINADIKYNEENGISDSSEYDLSLVGQELVKRKYMLDKQVKEVLRDRVFKTLDIDFSPNCENVCDAK